MKLNPAKQKELDNWERKAANENVRSGAIRKREKEQREQIEGWVNWIWGDFIALANYGFWISGWVPTVIFLERCLRIH